MSENITSYAELPTFFALKSSSSAADMPVAVTGTSVVVELSEASFHVTVSSTVPFLTRTLYFPHI